MRKRPPLLQCSATVYRESLKCLCLWQLVEIDAERLSREQMSTLEDTTSYENITLTIQKLLLSQVTYQESYTYHG